MPDSEVSLFLSLNGFSINMRNTAYRNWLSVTQIAKNVSEATVKQNHFAENDITFGTNIFRIQKENTLKIQKKNFKCFFFLTCSWIFRH